MPIVLLFHPGGFVSGGPEMMDEAVLEARAAGFRPIRVGYVQRAGFDVPRQVRSSTRLARRLVRRGREVYAYGESAGGLIAARLAQMGYVGAAAVQAPVSNLAKFVRALEERDSGAAEMLGVPTRKVQRKLSPSKNATRRPILAFVPAEDEVLPPILTLRWAERDRLVGSRAVPGAHLEHRQGVMRQAIRWLVNRRAQD